MRIALMQSKSSSTMEEENRDNSCYYPGARKMPIVTVTFAWPASVPPLTSCPSASRKAPSLSSLLPNPMLSAPQSPLILPPLCPHPDTVLLARHHPLLSSNPVLDQTQPTKWESRTREESWVCLDPIS